MKRWVVLGVFCALAACNEETAPPTEVSHSETPSVGDRVVEVPTGGNGAPMCALYGSDISLSIQNGASVLIPVPVMCNPNVLDKGYPLPDEKRNPSQSISAPVLEAPVNQSFSR